MEMLDEWYLSRNGEHYGPDAYATRDDAVASAVGMWRAVKSGEERFTELFDRSDAEAGCSAFHVGKRIGWHHEVDEDSIVCSAQEDAYDYAGDFSEGWLEDMTGTERTRLRELLQEAFDMWLAETGREPRFFMVGQCEEFDAESLLEG